MTAYPTEHPLIWGWSHVPFMGGVFEGNILEDCEQGGIVGVEHGRSIKTNKGRTYMSVELRDNVVRWTEPFLAQMARAGTKEPLAGLIVGYRPSADPDELIVSGQWQRTRCTARIPRPRGPGGPCGPAQFAAGRRSQVQAPGPEGVRRRRPSHTRAGRRRTCDDHAGALARSRPVPTRVSRPGEI